MVDDHLCVAGLAYGQDYELRLLPGFPSKDGGKLSEEQKVDVALGARPAVVTLPGKGFILPRGIAAGLPITTVNIAKLGISVYRVNERGLDKFIERYYATFPGTEPMTESWSLRQWLDGNNGKRLWRGTMEVRNALNQPVTTAFPVRETIKDWKPGAYFVVVWNAANKPTPDNEDDDDDKSGSAAGMWVMDTDIALTSFTGRDGLNVFARSLETAQPLANLEVTLLSRGNEPIGKAVTGADGRVTFPAGLMRGRGAAEPTAVMATDEGKQEFSRLELTKAAFDLSDRGIDGRSLPGPVDAFLYTERGVYRPGETVQLMAMLRDDSATALKDMPVTLIVRRPDGSEFTRYALALAGSGALYQAVPLPKSSRRGRWSVTAHIDPKAGPVGRVEFSVEDFVPEKLKVELQPEAPMLRDQPTNTLNVQADFLYGAPASGLTVEGDLRVDGRSGALPGLQQVLVRARGRAREVRAAADHPHRARHRRQGQVEDRMGRRQGEGHGAAAARPGPGARVRARQRPRHQDRQDAAAAHARRLSRHSSDLRGPLCARRRRDRVRPGRGRCRGQADRAPLGRLQDRAHHLFLPVVPERRSAGAGRSIQAERAGRRRHAGASRPMRRRISPSS